MSQLFDADALLAALPMRLIRPLPPGTQVRVMRLSVVKAEPGFGTKGEYNGFSGKERSRTAAVSNWLCSLSSVERAKTCDICGRFAHDEHAENYYDLRTWSGLCASCHRSTLHRRFERPAAWAALLDAHEKPVGHWSRLISPMPFDLAGLLRARGAREPRKADFPAEARVTP